MSPALGWLYSGQSFGALFLRQEKGQCSATKVDAMTRSLIVGFPILAAVLGLCAGCSQQPQAAVSPGAGGGANQPGGGGDGQGNDEGTGSWGGNVTGEDPATGQGGSSGELGCDKMDIVFVIDNSPSMVDEQQSLAESFPRMIEVLDRFKGGSLDYRVAVTTTAFPLEVFGMQVSDAAQGAFVQPSGVDRPWLERHDQDLAGKFSTIATVGTDGSFQEQPLKAALASVRERVMDGKNQGFRRGDSLLALVLLTDEDDSSGAAPVLPIPGLAMLDPVDDYVQGFDRVTGDRSRWAVSVIAGDSMCGESAQNAQRLQQFVSQVGTNATFSSICQGDLSEALEDALNTFTFACDAVVF